MSPPPSLPLTAGAKTHHIYLGENSLRTRAQSGGDRRLDLPIVTAEGVAILKKYPNGFPKPQDEKRSVAQQQHILTVLNDSHASPFAPHAIGWTTCRNQRCRTWHQGEDQRSPLGWSPPLLLNIGQSLHIDGKGGGYRKGSSSCADQGRTRERKELTIQPETMTNVRL